MELTTPVADRRDLRTLPSQERGGRLDVGCWHFCEVRGRGTLFRFRWISGRVAVAKFYPAGIEDCRSPDDECHGLPYRRREASNRAGWKDLHGQEELRLDLQQGHKRASVQ